MRNYLNKTLAAAAMLGVALAPAAALADPGERDETYHVMVDCGSVAIILASGSETEAEKDEYTNEAVMWMLVAGKYAGLETFDPVQADSEVSVQKVLAMVSSDQDEELTELLTTCETIKPTVAEVYAELSQG